MSVLNQNYRDLEGNMKSFTVIDHDKKTKINTTVNIDKHGVTQELADYRTKLQAKILDLPASACPDFPFSDFKVRDGITIGWNEVMIMDPGTPLNQLQDIYTLTSNKVSGSNRFGI